MVSIHYQEEQNYLKNYIFTKKKTVDNVWIGAKYNSTSKQFRWADNSTLNGYSNWAAGNPKNLTDHCVEMLADEGLEGKWAEDRCARNSRVVCQRMPLPSIWVISRTVIELKHSLQQTASKLAETESKLEKTEKSLVETKKEFLEKLNKESIPIGFIYVQLPKDKAPSELWPSMTWTDISADYEGVFFRVVGGDAASFGQVQQGNAPRLGTVHIIYDSVDEINTYHRAPYNLTIPMNGWSDQICTGSYSGSNNHYINFKLTDTGEVRPKNMAIKVYKRTA